MKKTAWRVEENGIDHIVVTNNHNASYYDYRRSSREQYLADPLAEEARRHYGLELDEQVRGMNGFWYLSGRDRHGNSLRMGEFTLGRDAAQLRDDLLDEAEFLATYLTRLNIREADDRWHIDAQLDRNPDLTMEWAKRGPT